MRTNWPLGDASAQRLETFAERPVACQLIEYIRSILGPRWSVDITGGDHPGSASHLALCHETSGYAIEFMAESPLSFTEFVDNLATWEQVSLHHASVADPKGVHHFFGKGVLCFVLLQIVAYLYENMPFPMAEAVTLPTYIADELGHGWYRIVNDDNYTVCQHKNGHTVVIEMEALAVKRYPDFWAKHKANSAKVRTGSGWNYSFHGFEELSWALQKVKDVVQQPCPVAGQTVTDIREQFRIKAA